MRRLFALMFSMVAITACDGCASQTPAVKKAEAACITNLVAKLGAEIAKAKASGQDLSGVALTIELGAEEAMCELEALTATSSGSGSGG